MAKYGNSKVNIDGISFDSKDEARYYEYLKKQREEGKILNFELQPKYELQPKFKSCGKNIRAITYSPDFDVYHTDGRFETVDIKGMSTQQGEMRRKMFLFRYPDIKLTWISRSLKYGNIDGEWIEYDELQKLRRKAKREKNL